MSVRSNSASVSSSLSGAEGELVSIRICVEPRLLERLLEVLALVSFPINPRIYHQAGIGYVDPNGAEDFVAMTMVEFPAFSSRLAEVREALQVSGLPPEAVHVRSMIEEIRSDVDSEAAPEGSRHCQVRFYKRLPRPSVKGAPGLSRF